VASVLVVSDDPSSREQLGRPLETEGFRVFFAAASSRPSIDAELDVAVVDLSCASGQPHLVIGVLRARTDVPIMAVATVTIAEATVLSAYRAGADQCVNGFARPRELVARVRALLRRSPHRSGEGDATAVAGFAVDVARCTAIVNGVEIALTSHEREILEALMRRPGRVVRREELVAFGLRASALDSYVRRLRDKLEAVDGRRRIVVVRGVGFRFDVG
jgi:DNA-binding response OmpR family regulator